jgi:hypothetical protein
MYTRVGHAKTYRGRTVAQPMGRDNGSHRLLYNLVEAMYFTLVFLEPLTMGSNSFLGVPRWVDHW